MKTLDGLLDALADRAGSDRRIAPMLKTSTAAISAWRTRRAYPDDEKARRIAELLQLDAAYVLAIVHGERAKSKETRATWQRVADAFTSGFDNARAAPTRGRKVLNTQCATSHRADLILRTLGLQGQQLAL